MKKYIKIFLFCLLLFSKSSAHGFEDWMAGFTLSIPTKYDFSNKEFLTGFDASLHFLFINMSLEHPSIIQGNDQTISYHIGLGFVSACQVQYGFDYRIRLRSDLVVFGDNSPLFSSIESGCWIFRKGVVLTPIIDIPLKKDKSWIVGLGFGLQI